MTQVRSRFFHSGGDVFDCFGHRLDPEHAVATLQCWRVSAQVARDLGNQRQADIYERDVQALQWPVEAAYQWRRAAGGPNPFEPAIKTGEAA